MSWARRPVLAGALAAAAVVLMVPAAIAAQRSAQPTAPSFTEHSYPATPTTPARSYWLYVPATVAVHPALVVFLHGCNETAPQAAEASHFNTVADEQGFVVAYPEQVVGPTSPPNDGNGVGCWNWYLPQDQSRGSGEPGALAGIAESVISTLNVDRRHVYVEGVSAGADMAVILGATYPDVFTAVGSLAGCPYRTCSDVTGVLTSQAMGSRARVVPLFVENGSADTLNPLPLSLALTTSWLQADNMAGAKAPLTPASTTTYEVDQTPQPGSGDACIHNNSLGCPGGVVGFRGSYPYTVSSYEDGAGSPIIQLWVIHGMQHAHPDAPGDGPYTDPLGPDVTRASYGFFVASTNGS